MLKQKAYNKKCPFCGEKIKPFDEIYRDNLNVMKENIKKVTNR